MQNKKIIRFSLFFVLALTLMSISVMAQASNSTTVEKFPIDTDAITCTGERIPVTGTGTLIVHMTTSNSGQVNVKTGYVLRLKGVDPITGAKYVGNATQEDSQQYDSIDEAPFTSTTTAHFNFLGVGGTSSLRYTFRAVIHSTVNASGDIASMKAEFNTVCSQ